MKLLLEKWNRFVEQQEIEEDLVGFKTKIADPNFQAAKLKGKEAKRIWNQEADQAFFKTLLKIHFAQGAEHVIQFLQANRRDEISTMLFAPGEEIETTWGWFGVLVDGRVTYANNQMDCVFSGMYWGLKDRQAKQARTSGISRKPTEERLSDQGCIDSAILDAASFKTKAAKTKKFDFSSNEAFVDNWRPIGIVVNENLINGGVSAWAKREFQSDLHRLQKIASEMNLPVYNNSMEPFDFEEYGPLGVKRL